MSATSYGMDTTVQQKIILVTDDEKDFREIVATKLRSAGFNVVEAENGEEAIKKAKEIKPDLLLLDVNMPGMSGIETITKIQSEPELAELKVIFLTNYGDPQKEAAWLDEKFAREIGAMDYIRKTEDLNKIATEIRSFLKEPTANESK